VKQPGFCFYLCQTKYNFYYGGKLLLYYLSKCSIAKDSTSRFAETVIKQKKKSTHMATYEAAAISYRQLKQRIKKWALASNCIEQKKPFFLGFKTCSVVAKFCNSKCTEKQFKLFIQSV